MMWLRARAHRKNNLMNGGSLRRRSTCGHAGKLRLHARISHRLFPELKFLSWNVPGICDHELGNLVQLLSQTSEGQFDVLGIQELSNADRNVSVAGGHQVFLTEKCGLRRRSALIVHSKWLVVRSCA